MLPPSFAKSGFVTPVNLGNKIKLRNGQILKGLLIGSDGLTDTGKTEFTLSTPGNIQMICVDRNFQGVFDNPLPPPTRNPNVGVKIFSIPMNMTAKVLDYAAYHKDVRESFYSALDNPESQVVVMDGDSDWWELHILAHFGKNTQIYPQTRYAAPYAERRAIVARAFDSGKIVYMTNKVRAGYMTVFEEDGVTPKKDPITGDELRRPSGLLETQGFKDRDYLYQIWLRHLYNPPHVNPITKKEVPGQYGVRITKCKHNMSLVGLELWGESCNFRGLIEIIYPDIDPHRFGF